MKKPHKGRRKQPPVAQLRETQCVQMHNELACSALLLTEHYWQWDMRNIPYFQDPEYLCLRNRRLRNDLLGSPETGYGLLQVKMNRHMDGVMDRLHYHFPHWEMEKRLLFSYYSAGFTNYLVQHLLGLSTDNSPSVIKSRMRDEIERLNRDDREEYLALLPQRCCRLGEELNYYNIL